MGLSPDFLLSSIFEETDGIRPIHIELLGGGHFGDTFQMQLGIGPKEPATVVSKLFSNTPLEEEVQALERLSGVEHANLVQLLRVVNCDNMCALVFEHCDGPDVRQSLLIDDGRFYAGLPVHERLSPLLDVCSALEYLHGLDIAHLNIKPSKIQFSGALCDSSPTLPRAKLRDLGCGSVIGKPSGIRLTSSKMDDIQYTSPEAFETDVLTVSSDVFSIGIVAFELLTCEPPFQSLQIPAHVLVIKIFSGTRPPLARLWADSQHLTHVLLQCWDGKPEGRGTIGEIRAKLLEEQ